MTRSLLLVWSPPTQIYPKQPGALFHCSNGPKWPYTHRSYNPSWWFQPIWNILVKMDHFPRQGWKYIFFETTTQKPIYHLRWTSHDSHASDWHRWILNLISIQSYNHLPGGEGLMWIENPWVEKLRDLWCFLAGNHRNRTTWKEYSYTYIYILLGRA